MSRNLQDGFPAQSYNHLASSSTNKPRSKANDNATPPLISHPQQDDGLSSIPDTLLEFGGFLKSSVESRPPKHSKQRSRRSLVAQKLKFGTSINQYKTIPAQQTVMPIWHKENKHEVLTSSTESAESIETHQVLSETEDLTIIPNNSEITLQNSQAPLDSKSIKTGLLAHNNSFDNFRSSQEHHSISLENLDHRFGLDKESMNHSYNRVVERNTDVNWDELCESDNSSTGSSSIFTNDVNLDPTIPKSPPTQLQQIPTKKPSKMQTGTSNETYPVARSKAALVREISTMETFATQNINGHENLTLRPSHPLRRKSTSSSRQSLQVTSNHKSTSYTSLSSRNTHPIKTKSPVPNNRLKPDTDLYKYKHMSQDHLDNLDDVSFGHLGLDKEQQQHVQLSNGHNKTDADLISSPTLLPTSLAHAYSKLMPVSVATSKHPAIHVPDSLYTLDKSSGNGAYGLPSTDNKDFFGKQKPHYVDLPDEKHQLKLAVGNAPINVAPSTVNSKNNRSLTLWRYLLLELGSQSSQIYDDEKIEQLDNFVRLPFYLERVIIFGCLACFDSFLYIFTILPLRTIYGVYLLFLRMFQFQRTRIPLTRKADIIKGAILVLVLYLLMQLDTSKIYHGIRGQSAIKLYVMFNVLEIADKLCSALGQDILDCLFSGKTLNISSRPRVLMLKKAIRPFVFIILAIIYIYVHSLAILYQIISLNVAVNSYSNALLTLLLSNQFSEIKSTVFKKFERENLFQLTCADVAERFQLTIMMMVIGIRNIVEVSSTGLVPRSWSGWNRWIGALFGPMLVVVGSEVCVDWLKHAYIAKFNNIRPRVYRKFMDVFVYDYSENSFSDQIMTKRIGIPILPLASVFLRMLFQSYSILVEHQQSVASKAPSTTAIDPTCTVTAFAKAVLGNETNESLTESTTSLSSLVPTVTSSAPIPAISSIKITLEKTFCTVNGSSNTKLFSKISTFLSELLPDKVLHWMDSTSSLRQTMSWQSFIYSYIPESADSFYSTVSMVLIVLTSFILLFCIKLALGLFLLQYSCKSRAQMMAKSKPFAQPPVNPVALLPNPSFGVASSSQSSGPQAHSLSAIPAQSTLSLTSNTSAFTQTGPATPIGSRKRSSSQIAHGSRRQSLSTRNAVSAGLASGLYSRHSGNANISNTNSSTETSGNTNNNGTNSVTNKATTSGCTRLAHSSTGSSTNLASSNMTNRSSSPSTYGVGTAFSSGCNVAGTVSMPLSSVLSSTSNSSSTPAAQSTCVSTNTPVPAAGNSNPPATFLIPPTNHVGSYESDESDHVPGPIKGQGVVEVNETVRERMYDADEPVPPPKPRKTNIKDFKDLCKIHRFKMTAKQIW